MLSLPESSDEFQTPPATKTVAVDPNMKVKGQHHHEAFVDTMSLVMKMLSESKRRNYDDVEIDLIETAKKRGMTFPRPRWWPEQGLKD